MIAKRILVPDRVRQVPTSFSWLDHRLLRKGYLRRLSPTQILLYFFLVLVGDRHGVSYYSLPSIAKILKLSPEQLRDDRTSLCRLDLIAYQAPLYQVLSLPDSLPVKSLKPSPAKTQFHSPSTAQASISSIKEILEEIL